MCFCAPASFIAGTVLSVTGVVSVRTTKSPIQVPLATVPLVFGIQQLIEGMLWLTLHDQVSHSWFYPSALAFLIFAQVIWPLWTPMVMLIPETNKKRRIVLWILLSFGTVLALYHGWCLFHYPIAVSVSGKHINYLRDFPKSPAKIIAAVYVLATILPGLISSVPKMRLVGITTLLSFLLSFFIFRESLISVWCFFAAIISAGILYVIVQWNKQIQTTP